MGIILGFSFLVYLFVSLPFFQNWLGSKVALYLSDKLGTKVEIGRIEIGLLGHIVIDDLDVWDRQSEHMLHATRTGAQIDIFDYIRNKNITINSAQLFGAKMYIYQENPDSAFNFQFFIDAFAGKDSIQKPLPHIEVHSIMVRHTNINFEKKWKKALNDRIDPNHLELREISLKAAINELTNDGFDIDLKKLSFTEKSGLKLKEAQTHFLFKKSIGWKLDNLFIATANSNFRSPSIQYSSKGINAELEARITPSDFAFVHPTFAQISDIWNLSINTEYQKEKITISHINLLHEEGKFALNASADITHWNDSIPTINAHINKLSLKSGIENVIQPIQQNNTSEKTKNNGLGDQISKWLSDLGETDVNGRFCISRQNAKASINVNCALGSLEGNGSYQNGNLMATVKTERFDLGKILSTNKDTISQVGHITAEAEINAKLKNKDVIPTGTLRANIKEAKFRNYIYHDITLDASRKGDNYKVTLFSNDPHALINADLRASLSKQSPFVQGFANIDNLDLHTTHLAPTSHIKNIVTRAGIDLQGGPINNMEGHISIPHILVSTNDTTFTFTNLQVVSMPEGKQRHIRFTSPYLTLDGNGEFDPLSIIDYIQMLGHNWMPDVIEQPHKNPGYTDATFNIQLTDPEPLKPLAGIDISLGSSPLSIEASMQSNRNWLEAKASASDISIQGFKMQNLKALLTSENKDMNTHISLDQTLKNTPVQLNIDIATKDDQLATSIKWDNEQTVRNSGEIILHGLLERNGINGLTVKADMQPSKVYINDTIWNIHHSQLEFRDGKLNVNNFRFFSDDKERGLTIKGIASSHTNDSLLIDLQNIDLEYIFTIVKMKPISLGGRVTGKLLAHHVFKNPIASGNVVVPNFLFNGASMGLLNTYISWGDTPGSLSLRGIISDATANSNLNVIGQIHLIKDPTQHLDLDIQFKRANCAFLQRYVGTFLDNFQGRASGHARLFGSFKDVDIDANALIHEAGFTLAPLGTRYNIKGDSVQLHNGRIDFKDVVAYDREGKPGQKNHSAVMNGVVTHQYFRNMCYNLNFDATHLLGYDQRDFNDLPFFATVYATGNVKLEGKPGRTDINIDITPVGKSTFTYNASGPEAITKAGFISYVDRSEELKAKLEGIKKQTEIKKPAGDMYMNFNFHLTQDLELRLLMDQRTGDGMSLFGNCNNLYATYYNKGRFQMYGTYHVDHGTYKMTIQDVIHKDFHFRPNGSIVFGGNPFNADLNLKAAYTVPSVSLNDLSAKGTFSNSTTRVDCLMNIGGTAGEPRVTFDFDIPNVNEDERRMVRSLISTDEERNMQVIYLLGIGRFYTYDYTGTQTQSETAMNSLLSSTLSDQLNQVFNRVTNNTNWNFGANLSTGTMGWSDMDVEGMLSGRLLNNRLLINGSFGYRDNPVAASNFIGDFDIQYLLNKNGNIVLKAYSETNDRYFTKSALTTQGVGIMVKKDFTKLSDLFGKKHKK